MGAKAAGAQAHDVVVVGGGPSGASAALWLARAGWDVAVFERKRFPRPKTCGDGLTPRAVRQLEDMGLGGALASKHRIDGLRSLAFGRSLEMPWPAHPSFPSHGYVIERSELDAMVLGAAEAAGATVHQTSEATPLLGQDGDPIGIKVRSASGEREVTARFVIVADGANSRFGRALGARRIREWPMGLAIRGHWRSPRSEDNMIESRLDLRDASGAVVPGYGWVFPLGDGRVNVGVGLLTSEGRWKGFNTTKLLARFLEQCSAWGIDPANPLAEPTGGKLPMGFSVGPRAGRRHILVGDAAGSINPFNGEGIAYGYETGRLGAWAVAEALSSGDPEALSAYPRRLEEAYALYERLGRAFVRLISKPTVLQACVATGMVVPATMRWMLRLMANLMYPEEIGPPEAAYRALAALASHLPISAEAEALAGLARTTAAATEAAPA